MDHASGSDDESDGEFSRIACNPFHTDGSSTPFVNPFSSSGIENFADEQFSVDKSLINHYSREGKILRDMKSVLRCEDPSIISAVSLSADSSCEMDELNRFNNLTSLALNGLSTSNYSTLINSAVFSRIEILVIRFATSKQLEDDSLLETLLDKCKHLRVFSLPSRNLTTNATLFSLANIFKRRDLLEVFVGNSSILAETVVDLAVNIRGCRLPAINSFSTLSHKMKTFLRQQTDFQFAPVSEGGFPEGNYLPPIMGGGFTDAEAQIVSEYMPRLNRLNLNDSGGLVRIR